MKLFHKIYGETGTPMFILHGLFGMLDNWHNIAKKLSEEHHYKVITVDLRNHGQSPHSDTMHYNAMADDVWELMSDLSIENAVILGHSMGGKVAMQFASKYPEKVKKLIVVDIAPKEYLPGHQVYFDAFSSINLKDFKSRQEVDEAFAQWEPNTAIRLFLLKNIERVETGGFRLKCNLNAIYNSYSEIIGRVNIEKKITLPTLFVKGSNSGYIKKEDETNIISQFPNAAFITINGAGHWVHAEKPMEFINAII